jgi:ABC-type Zn uptake system ZnuABC Zn-binding protein ZnuA
LLIVMALGVAAGVPGCSRRREPKAGLRVLCTTFPVWLLARNVTKGADGVTVELLLPAQLGCPHDYVVTPADIRRLDQADVLIANGLGLDSFATDRFRRERPSKRIILAAEGISQPLDEDPWHHDGHRQGHEHGMNPHLFASPVMAARMAERIASGLGQVDPAHRELYQTNHFDLERRYVQMSDEMSREVHGLANRRIITQHDAFEWLAHGIGLEIVGVIQAHAGHDPSAQEIAKLVRTARETGAGAVMTEPQYPPRVGETIAREAGIRVGVLDPCAGGPADAPLDYYEQTMRKNMAELRRVLGSKPADD